MSTATNISTITQFARHGKTMFWRFVWKEFRMVRSLWVAVAIMGLVAQCAEKLLLPNSSEFLLILLYAGLAAAVLYAAGAAATTFSVEHEEETYDLLTRIPTTWWPPFAGKVLVTLASALLLAVMLSLCAIMLRGSNSIQSNDTRAALGVLGFAIVEAVAWGTLFSLLIKRPLLAAIITLAAGAIAVNVAVSYVSSNYATASLDSEAYIRALPFRMVIVAAVFACSTYVASGWLTPGGKPSRAMHLRRNSRIMTWLAGGRSHAREAHATVERASRRRMLSHLLWQTWRESWKLLFLPLAIAALLPLVAGVVTALVRPDNEVVGFILSIMPIFIPALYGALAFYADQRRGSYRFFAEHAARPRYIWLARHIVWLGALIVAWFVAIAVLAAVHGSRSGTHSRETFGEYLEWRQEPIPLSIYYSLAVGTEMAIRALSAASFGALVAYSIGQLASMTIRSEILTAFLAMLLSLVVGAWVYVILLWRLSAAQFMLPIFAGLMLATWLRAPDWIAGRDSWRGWWKPALAIALPLVLIAAMLPAARLAQLGPTDLKDQQYLARLNESERIFTARLAAFQGGNTTEAAQTADMYIRVAEKLAADTGSDPLARWRRKNEYKDKDDEIIAANIPASERSAFRLAQRQHVEYAASIKKLLAAAIDEAIEISKRPNCRFKFDVSLPPHREPWQEIEGQIDSLKDNRTYTNLNNLRDVVAGLATDKGDQPIPRFVAALKMGKHLRSGQPSIVVIEQLKAERNVLQHIGNWSLDSDRAKEELHDLLDRLTPELQAPESPAESFLADHLAILDVISGQQTPIILATSPVPPSAYLAYLANQLSWERTRAEFALTRITRTNYSDAEILAEKINSSDPRKLDLGVSRHWVKPSYDPLPPLWEIRQPAAATSYLVSLEYKARVPVTELNRAYIDNVTVRHATLLQIAVALYRLEHKTYPTQLADLVPKYLEQLPLDPYSRQPFQYVPNGLSLPLDSPTLEGMRQRIERHQPLFWSAGAGNVRLVQFERRTVVEDLDKPAPADDTPRPEKLEPAYGFYSEDPTWGADNFTFPLPK